MEINNDFEIAKKRIEAKYWKCPKCGFLTTNEEMQSIVFEPTCRCYNRTGMTWGDFVPVITDSQLRS